MTYCIINKTGLQPVSRPVELVDYFGGWVEGQSKQTDRTDGGWCYVVYFDQLSGACSNPKAGRNIKKHRNQSKNAKKR